MARIPVAWLTRWGIIGVLSVVGAYVVHYGFCRTLGTGWDACSFGGGGPELLVLAAVLMAVAVVARW